MFSSLTFTNNNAAAHFLRITTSVYLSRKISLHSFNKTLSFKNNITKIRKKRINKITNKSQLGIICLNTDLTTFGRRSSIIYCIVNQ